MTKNFRSFLKYSVLVVLIAVTALSFLSCEKEEASTGAEITITVEVVHKSGESTEHTLTTTKTTLADALTEASLASGTLPSSRFHTENWRCAQCLPLARPQ